MNFSLYLVHEPIVVTLAKVWPHAPAWVVLLPAVPLALVAATVFYRLVESRAHVLSKRLGRRFGAARVAPGAGESLAPSAQ